MEETLQSLPLIYKEITTRLAAEADNSSDNTNLSDFLPTLCRHPVNLSSSKCKELSNAVNAIDGVYIVAAFIVLIGLSFTQKRTKCLPQCCWFRPSLVIPVNLLNNSKYRLVYTIIFGSMSSIILSTVTGGVPSNLQVSNPYAQAILSILSTTIFVILIAILFYPLFACVDTPIPLIGHILGAVYATIVLVESALSQYRTFSGCNSGCQAEGAPYAVLILSTAPILLFDLFLLLWFIGSVIYDIIEMIRPTKHSEFHGRKHLKAHIQRVRTILKKPPSEDNPEPKWKIIISKIYAYDPGFKFPLRFLAAMIITAVILYQLTLIALYQTIQLARFFGELSKLVISFTKEIADSDAFDSVNLSPVITVGEIVGGFALGIGILLPVSITIASVICVIQLLLIFRNVRDNLLRTARGDFSCLPEKHPPIRNCLISSLRYPGYQVAYIIWAWVVYALLIFLLVLVLGIGIILLIFLHDILVPKIVVFIIGILWAQGIYWFQFFLVKYVFLEKPYPDLEHEILNNRRFFHWFAYVLLFQNAFVGLFSTFIRIIISLAFGLILFMRLDKVVLMKGFEFFDFAHKTYIGFLYLDYTQNNPVQHVFCQLLLEGMEKRRRDSGIDDVIGTGCCVVPPVAHKMEYMAGKYTEFDDESNSIMPTRPYVSQRAYNRWQVAYTLLRNEKLVKYTSSGLQAKRKSLIQKIEADTEDTGENSHL